MTAAPPSDLLLVAATLLRIPARRVCALALGDASALRDWIVNESATRLAEARRDARYALSRLEALGGHIVVLGTATYPPGLRDLRDPPPFLCVRGTLPRAHWRAGTAIVGTRDADQCARTIAHELAGRVPGPIVSGLARGIDAAAHAGALAAGIATYAYVGNGLGATYPPEHGDLAERIVVGGGAILTELLPDERVTRWSLVRRDRLQAAHAAAVVLVQSEPGGGAMQTLGIARELGRARFAFAVRETAADGGNALALAAGATALRWDVAHAAAAITAFESQTLGDDA